MCLAIHKPGSAIFIYQVPLCIPQHPITISPANLLHWYLLYSLASFYFPKPYLCSGPYYFVWTFTTSSVLLLLLILPLPSLSPNGCSIIILQNKSGHVILLSWDLHCLITAYKIYIIVNEALHNLVNSYSSSFVFCCSLFFFISLILYVPAK